MFPLKIIWQPKKKLKNKDARDFTSFPRGQPARASERTRSTVGFLPPRGSFLQRLRWFFSDFSVYPSHLGTCGSDADSIQHSACGRESALHAGSRGCGGCWPTANAVSGEGWPQWTPAASSRVPTHRAGPRTSERPTGHFVLCKN